MRADARVLYALILRVSHVLILISHILPGCTIVRLQPPSRKLGLDAPGKTKKELANRCVEVCDALRDCCMVHPHAKSFLVWQTPLVIVAHGTPHRCFPFYAMDMLPYVYIYMCVAGSYVLCVVPCPAFRVAAGVTVHDVPISISIILL